MHLHGRLTSGQRRRGASALRRALSLVLTSCLLLVAATSSAGAAGDEERRDLSDNRDAQQDLGAQIEQLEQSIGELALSIQNFDLELVRLAFAVADADDELRDSRRRATEAQLAVARAVVEELGAEQSVEEGLREAYVRPPSDVTGSYLLARDGDDAGRRVVLIGAVVSQRQDELESIRRARAERERAIVIADAAAATAEQARREVVDLQMELALTRQRHAEHVAVLETRLEEHLAEIEALAEEEAALVRLIRRLEAEAARAAGTPPSSLIWPASGWVSSEFGPRWGRNHNGIDMVKIFQEMVNQLS